MFPLIMIIGFILIVVGVYYFFDSRKTKPYLADLMECGHSRKTYDDEWGCPVCFGQKYRAEKEAEEIAYINKLAKAIVVEMKAKETTDAKA